VLPKVILEEWQRLDSPASFAMPTADELNQSTTCKLHLHGHTTCILYVNCANFPIPLPRKEIYPFLTGDICAQNSHWNSGKMKIAYNSAYVQIETFNFTLAQQAIIVYVYVPTSKKLLCRMPNIKAQADYFLPIMSDCTSIASRQSIGYGC